MNNSAIVHAVFLRASHGIVVFKLGPPEAGGGKKAAARRAGGEGGPRAGGGPQPIAGEMVLRKGYYIAPDDVRMKLEGLYDAATGALNLTATHHDLYAHLGDQGEIIKRPFKEKEGVEYRQDLPWETGKPSFLGFGDSSAGPDMLRKCDVKLTLQATSNAEVRRQIANGTFYGPQEENFGAVPFQLGHESIQYLKLAGAVESETCDWKLHLNGTSLKLEQYTVKLTNYSLVVSTLCVLQVLFIVKQIEYSASQAAALKVSLASIGQQAVIDAYICLVHLSASVAVDALFNAFATVALFKFIVFSIFEMRYLLGLWRIRRASEDTYTDPRQEASILYSRFYGCLMGGVILAFQFREILDFLLLALYSFWVPQIARSVYHDTRKPLAPVYVLGMSATRLVIPLYFYGWPSNFLGAPVKPGMCVLFVLWVGAQAGALLLQHYHGPQSFIPKQYLPTKYDYHRAVRRGSLLDKKQDGPAPAGNDMECGGGSECVICMLPVDVWSTKSRMVTPCNHFFHTECLERWLAVKLECPTCRRTLPPP